MNLKNISLPDVYTNSADFRFFIDWISTSLSKIQYDIENLSDILDPLRCPSKLLWMLGDTMGFKFDNRVSTAFNRLVILYFMSLIRNKGSRDGMMLAAELNLAQHVLNAESKENPQLWERLENTSIPANSAYVSSNVEDGYINVVYFSSEMPIDTCTDYVRPLGMYCFQAAGVKMDSNTKISIDARLMDERDIGMSIGPTHIGKYSRDDYAKLQRWDSAENKWEPRNQANSYYHNSTVANEPTVNPGLRTLYSLQLANNTNVMKALIDPLFEIGKITEVNGEEIDRTQLWNLIYNKGLDDEKTGYSTVGVRDGRSDDVVVNPTMFAIGDAIAMNDQNTKYTKHDADGNIVVDDPVHPTNE